MPPNFDITSEESIVRYAKEISGKSISMVCDDIVEYEVGNKGSLGQIIEKYYFDYEPNSDEEPDFKEVNLELKVSPLKELKNGKLKAKERISLSMIDYDAIIGEVFSSSKFYKKNARLILMFYLYVSDISPENRIFKLIGRWDLEGVDLEIIRSDWTLIKKKISLGRAHELSEGDTFYLGAATKGSSSNDLRTQPNTNEMAKRRAFSLKQGYVNHIIATLSNQKDKNWGKLVDHTDALNAYEIKDRKGIEREELPIEEYIEHIFSAYIGLNNEAIEKKLNIQPNRNAKSYYASLIKGILGVQDVNRIEEFDKADIKIKVIRINQDNLPKEHLSFPAFKFEDLVGEEWEESQLLSLLEKKYFFVFLRANNNQVILDTVKFWNMPFKDRQEMRTVWQKTKEVLESGFIVKKITARRWFNNFPSPSENKVGHVRPHARNRNDTNILPVQDKKTGMNSFTKQSFWLNQQYIKESIYEN